jgi:hypothetical protein
VKVAKLIHGMKYDYSKVVFVSSNKKVTIVCEIHDEFTQTPKQHCKGQGCKRCACLSSWTSMRTKNTRNVVFHIARFYYKS